MTHDKQQGGFRLKDSKRQGLKHENTEIVVVVVVVIKIKIIIIIVMKKKDLFVERPSM